MFLFVMFFWCPCMTINNVSVQYNGGLVVRLVSHMRSSETHVFFPDYCMCFSLLYSCVGALRVLSRRSVPCLRENKDIMIV